MNRAVKTYSCIPLVVIARDNRIAEKYWVKYGIPENEAVLYEAEWRRLQIELSRLTERGQFIVADNSDHEVYIDKPEIIVQCLKTLILSL